MIIIETCPKCGHDLDNLMIATYPPIHKKVCPACGWSWTDNPDEIQRIPFAGNGRNLSEKPMSNDDNAPAYWITHGENNDVFECSNCHNETWDEKTPYCPYCGSRMSDV